MSTPVNSDITKRKVCTKCGKRRLRSAFTRDSRRKDGLNCHCRECTRANTKAYQSKYPEKVRSNSRRWYLANKARNYARTTAWRKANPGKNAEYSARWREKNPGAQSVSQRKWYSANRERALRDDKLRRERNIEVFLERERASYARYAEARKLRSKEWRRKNPHKINVYAAQRRSALTRRTPPWLTQEHLAWMETIFWYALFLTEMTGVKHHVDHVVPLRGRLVSGLNVPWNLEAIPAVDNLKKSNRHAT